MVDVTLCTISPDTLLALYTSMARIRVVEECVARAYSRQKMRCPVHLCVGQEAITAGACEALRQDDAVLATHRSHGAYFAKGGDMVSFFKELHGKAGGCTEGRGGSMHLAAPEVGFLGAVPIVGSSIAIATGLALAFQMRCETKVCVVFFGDGATEEGVFHESLQYAALKKLPIVYICENNGFSVNTPLHERRSPQASLTGMAQAHGVFSSSGDGNIVLDVYTQTQQAVERARQGKGPSFLEFTTYRWLEHCGYADDHHLPVRCAATGLAWKKRCPLKQFETLLVQDGVYSTEFLQAIVVKMQTEAQQALLQAEEAPWPDHATADAKVYAQNDDCNKHSSGQKYGT